MKKLYLEITNQGKLPFLKSECWCKILVQKSRLRFFFCDVDADSYSQVLDYTCIQVPNIYKPFTPLPNIYTYRLRSKLCLIIVII